MANSLSSSGYSTYSRPKKTLASAAGKYQDPFGLSAPRASNQSIAKFAVAPSPGADPTGSGQSLGARPPAQPVAPRQPTQPVSERPLASPVTPYDINMDPIYQQITALLGKSDEQAQASALKQRKHALLAYGDPNLARALGDEDTATAAGQNPTSILKSLGTQREKNTHDLTEYLNDNNLLYSGNRIVREGEAATDYQNALAKAAADVEGALGTIDSNLSGALGANQLTKIAGMGAATDRHKDEHTGGDTGPPILPTPYDNQAPLAPALPPGPTHDAGYTPMPQLVVAAGNEQQTPRRQSDPTGRTKTNPTLSLADLFRLLGG